jgi:hypothetical protein
VSAAACTSCARNGLVLRGGRCGTCRAAGRVERCADCGADRTVSTRTVTGEALCGTCRCRRRSAATTGVLRAEVTATIVAARPDVDGSVVAAAVARAAPQLRQAVWLLDAFDDADVLAGSTTAPRVVDRLVAELTAAAVSQVVAPRCVRCGRSANLSQRVDGHRCCVACAQALRVAVCGRCGRQRSVMTRGVDGVAMCGTCRRKDRTRWERCAGCAKPCSPARRLPDGAVWCRRCNRPLLVCAGCGQRRPCEGGRSGEPRCEPCARRRDECSWCHRTAKVAAVWATGPVCPTCRYKGLEAKAACDGCGQWRRPDPRDLSGRCSDCVGLPALCVCQGCGLEDRIYRSGRCYRCVLTARVDTLLPSDTASLDVSALREVLTATDHPRAVLRWLSVPLIADALERIVAGRLAVTHAGIDTLGTTLSVDKLRAVLVSAGLLAARDEQVARLETWVDARLAGIDDDDDRRTVEAFATWWVLRRMRNRARRQTTVTTKHARRQIAAAVGFMAFLDAHQRSLGECSQADVELWLAGPPSRRAVIDFVAWARRHRLCGPLDVPRRVQGWPARRIDASAHRDLVVQLLNDSTLAVVDRVAGLFVTCYGQTPARIVGLGVDDVTIDDTVTVRFGRDKIVLAPTVGVLVAELVATRRGRAATELPSSSRWLFPGGVPGRHLHHDRLCIRLSAIGIDSSILRTAALLDLAAEVPASILADLVGLHTLTATRWTRAAGGDWAGYAAARSRQP